MVSVRDVLEQYFQVEYVQLVYADCRAIPAKLLKGFVQAAGKDSAVYPGNVTSPRKLVS